jgi:protein ImuB
MFACIYIPNASAETGLALSACASTFSPRVEVASAGTVVFDVEGLERLFGSYPQIAERIGDGVLNHLNCTSNSGDLVHRPRIALAANPDAAICAAHGFKGITILNRGTEADRLRNLPLHVLSPSPETLETLDRWGIRTLGELAQLPPVQVAERLGQDGVKLHQRAKGAGVRTLVPHADPVRFIEVMELDYEITTIEPLTFILTRMLDHICARMRSRNLATHEIRLALGSYVRVLNLPLPVRNARLLTRLLILDLEGNPPGAPIRRVELEAIPAKPRVVQNGLFVPLSPEPEKLELTLARLKAVVGEGNVGAAETLDTHRPDAFEVRKFSSTAQRLDDTKAQKFALGLRRFRPPREATVQLRNKLPSWIAFHNAHGPISTASGPWRTSGDWWRPTMWDREEWDIEVLDTLYRIYYDVHLDRWYVQGVYD